LKKGAPAPAKPAEPEKKEEDAKQLDFRGALKKKDTPTAAPAEEKKSEGPEQKDFRGLIGKKK